MKIVIQHLTDITDATAHALLSPFPGIAERLNERAWVVRHTLFTVGVQLRQDRIRSVGLYATEDRQRRDTVRQDRITETAAGLFVEAAGGSTADVVKVTVWMKDRSQRPALNVPWLEMFPDAATRPARHAIHAPELDMGKLIECVFTAYIA